MRDIERRVGANRLNGIDAEVVTAEQDQKGRSSYQYLAERALSDSRRVAAAPRGVARHDAVAWGFARAADALGVDIIQQCEVTGINRHVVE